MLSTNRGLKGSSPNHERCFLFIGIYLQEDLQAPAVGYEKRSFFTLIAFSVRRHSMRLSWRRVMRVPNGIHNKRRGMQIMVAVRTNVPDSRQHVHMLWLKSARLRRFDSCFIVFQASGKSDSD